MAQPEGPAPLQDPTAVESVIVEIPPEILAQTLGEYLRAWVARIRSGESGVLPVIVGLAGLLILNGVMLILLLLAPFSGYPSLTGAYHNVHVIQTLMWGTIAPV